MLRKFHIQLAKIQLSSFDERVLEHEIGHALGWVHVGTRGHLMHPEWAKGGWNTFGLEFKEK